LEESEDLQCKKLGAISCKQKPSPLIYRIPIAAAASPRNALAPPLHKSRLEEEQGSNGGRRSGEWQPEKLI
jgi:hypothetical protein